MKKLEQSVRRVQLYTQLFLYAIDFMHFFKKREEINIQ